MPHSNDIFPLKYESSKVSWASAEFVSRPYPRLAKIYAGLLILTLIILLIISGSWWIPLNWEGQGTFQKRSAEESTSSLNSRHEVYVIVPNSILQRIDRENVSFEVNLQAVNPMIQGRIRLPAHKISPVFSQKGEMVESLSAVVGLTPDDISLKVPENLLDKEVPVIMTYGRSTLLDVLFSKIFHRNENL